MTDKFLDEVLLEKLQDRLIKQVNGDIYFDPLSKVVWSEDASIFCIKPLGVAIPKTKEDLCRIVSIAAEFKIPLTARGAATGITGGCLGEGIVVDVSRYLNRIIEVNYDKRYAIVEPGVILDDLNTELAKNGYRFAPETSTSNRATLGGMAANNAAGARSIKYGKTVNHVLEVELVLSDGKTQLFKKLSEDEWLQEITDNSDLAPFLNRVKFIQTHYKKEIEDRFPKLDRRVSGYNLDELLKEPFPNLAKLIVGSEGTLGIISSLKINIIKKPPQAGLFLIHFNSLLKAFEPLNFILKFNPLAIEVLDKIIMHSAAVLPRFKGRIGWLHAESEGLLIVEFEGDNENELLSIFSDFEKELKKDGIGFDYTKLLDKEGIAAVWELRKAGLGLLMSRRTQSRAIAFIEDIAVPPDSLFEFMTEFTEILKRENKEAGIYGHAGSGCLHIRPYINLQSSDEVNLMNRMQEEIADLLLKYQGALSGEHGDGLIRSSLNEKMFGAKVMEAFKLVKSTFDPVNLMNPGKIVNALPLDDLIEDFRLHPHTKTLPLKTFFDFSKEGGLDLAADLCNGNGLCRKKTGTMCPSFQATGKETDSTRGRANTLQALIHDKLPSKSWNSSEMLEVLDLCLECKACKTECPSQVHMAKIKSEFLYQYSLTNGIPLRSKALASFSQLLKWGSYFPKLVNGFMSTSLAKFLQTTLGLAEKRKFPKLATETFTEWFKKQPASSSNQPVVIFVDTYTEFTQPSIGISTYKILTQLGYQVIVPEWRCCGRAKISKGMLPEASAMAKKLIDSYTLYIEKNIPIIVLEPSCLSALIDEYKDFPEVQNNGMSRLCFSLEQFLTRHIHEGKLPLAFKTSHQKIKVHGHCHQKALIGMKPTLDVLSSIPSFTVEEIPSGCCGMAGSFGYEKEHFDLSLKIGELVLFPAVRKAEKETWILASGFSCRSQILDGTSKPSLHLAEVIAKQML